MTRSTFSKSLPALFALLVSSTGCTQLNKGPLAGEGDGGASDAFVSIDAGMDSEVFADMSVSADLGDNDAAEAPDLGVAANDASTSDAAMDATLDATTDASADASDATLDAPTDMPTDMPIVDMGVDMAASCTYSCGIDLLSNSTSCGLGGATGITSYNPGSPASAGNFVGEISMSGIASIDITMMVCAPTGFAFDLCDDVGGCNGYGGGGTGTGYTAELNLIGTNLILYGNNFTPAAMGGAGAQLFSAPNFVPPMVCSTVTLTLADTIVQSSTGAINWSSPNGLRVNATDPIASSADDASWFFAINRTVADATRTGTGVQMVNFCFHHFIR